MRVNIKKLVSLCLVSLFAVVQIVLPATSVAATTVSITSPTANSSVGGSSFTVTGTATAKRLITVSVNGAVVGTTTSDNSGNWSLEVTNQTAGLKTISATASVQYVYATNAGDATLSVFNAATNEKIGSNVSSGGANQTNIVMRPDGAQMVSIAGFGGNAAKVWSLADQSAPVISNNITAADTNTVGLAYTPSGDEFWITSFDGVGGFTIRAYDSSNPATFTDVTGYTGFAPAGFGFNNDGTRAYIADCADNNIHVINTTTMAEISTFAGQCGGVGIGSGNVAYSINTSSSNITPINIGAETSGSAIVVGGSPTGLIFNADASRIYVSSPNGGTGGFVSEVNTGTNAVANTYAIGGSPRFTVFNADYSRAYVSDSVAGTMTVRNGTTFATISALSAGSETTGLTITPLESASTSVNFTYTGASLADTGQSRQLIQTLAILALVLPAVYLVVRRVVTTSGR